MSVPEPRKKQGYTVHNRVRLVHGGGEYFREMQRMIDDARHSLHLQTYIYEDDLTGGRITEALVRAAGRGVRVFVLLDGYASRSLSKDTVARFESAGVHFRYFEPLFRSRSHYVGRRMHHKIVVGDASEALVGGLNVSDRYNDLPGQPAWLDWAILAEGQSARELFRLCVSQWVRFPQEVRRIVDRHPSTPPDEAWQCLVRIRRNDWVNRKNQVSRTYLEMFREAEREVVVMSSYFLPGRVFRRNMRLAVKRGVRIRLILAGRSDVWLAKQAERYMYSWLLRNGIEIHEYERNILHGKIAVRDAVHVTCGSYNVNNISAYASVELNLDVLDEPFGSHVKQVLERIIDEDCTPVTEAGHRTRYNVLQLAMQFVAYEMFRVVLFLFTFYFRQKGR